MALTKEDLTQIQNMINKSKTSLPQTLYLEASNPTINDFPLVEALLDTDLILGEHLDTGDNFKTNISLIKNTIKKFLLNTRIGELYININNQYKDASGFNDGNLAYLLLDGQTIKKTDYPDLAEKWGIKTYTFILPDFSQNGGTTLRHAVNRDLGSYEADSFKSHLHDNSHGHTSNPHDHDMDHQHEVDYVVKCDDKSGESVCVDNFKGAHLYMTENTLGGRKITGDTTVIINNFSGNTGTTGATETKMKNIAVQFYVVAKVFNV